MTRFLNYKKVTTCISKKTRYNINYIWHSISILS